MTDPQRQMVWRLTAFTVLAYEAAALASRGRVPFISTLVRGLPRPARAVASLAVAAVVHDHFDTQRFF